MPLLLAILNNWFYFASLPTTGSQLDNQSCVFFPGCSLSYEFTAAVLVCKYINHFGQLSVVCIHCISDEYNAGYQQSACYSHCYLIYSFVVIRIIIGHYGIMGLIKLWELWCL